MSYSSKGEMERLCGTDFREAVVIVAGMRGGGRGDVAKARERYKAID